MKICVFLLISSQPCIDTISRQKKHTGDRPSLQLKPFYSELNVQHGDISDKLAEVAGVQADLRERLGETSGGRQKLQREVRNSRIVIKVLQTVLEIDAQIDDFEKVLSHLSSSDNDMTNVAAASETLLSLKTKVQECICLGGVSLAERDELSTSPVMQMLQDKLTASRQKFLDIVVQGFKSAFAFAYTSGMDDSKGSRDTCLVRLTINQPPIYFERLWEICVQQDCTRQIVNYVGHNMRQTLLLVLPGSDQYVPDVDIFWSADRHREDHHSYGLEHRSTAPTRCTTDDAATFNECTDAEPALLEDELEADVSIKEQPDTLSPAFRVNRHTHAHTRTRAHSTCPCGTFFLCTTHQPLIRGAQHRQSDIR